MEDLFKGAYGIQTSGVGTPVAATFCNAAAYAGTGCQVDDVSQLSPSTPGTSQTSQIAM